MPAPLPPAAPSLSSITQSREFTDAVRAHVLFILESSGKPVPAPNPDSPRKSADSKPVAPQPPAPLTERETGMLADLLNAAALRIEVAGADVEWCTLFIPEVNRQFQQDYDRDMCEELARKLVALSRKDGSPVLAGGNFIRVRNMREGVTVVDFDPKSIAPLRNCFLSK